MSVISIWHWVIVLLLLLIPFGLPALAVHLERTDIRLRRSGFLWWVIVPFFIAIIFELLKAFAGLSKIAILVGEGVMFVAACPYTFIFFQRVVRRARDAGLGKAIAYWSIVPIINVGTILYLLFKPGSQSSTRVAI